MVKLFYEKLCKYFSNNVKMCFADEKNYIVITKEGIFHLFDKDKYRSINEIPLFALSNDESFIKTIISYTTFNALFNKTIVDIKSSETYTIVKTADSFIYPWKYNTYIMGEAKTYDNFLDDDIINHFKYVKIRHFACGNSYNAVLTENNEVYVWGLNEYAEIGSLSKKVPIPHHVEELKDYKILNISCGYEHILVLTECGCVFSWGANNWGELGIGSMEKYSYKPKKMEIDTKFIRICCGVYYSLLLSTDGDIFFSGRDFTTGLNRKYKRTPQKINHKEKFIDIKSYYLYNLSAALSKSGKFYVWGSTSSVVISKYSYFKYETTDFSTFNQIFAEHFQITINPIHNSIFEYEDDFVRDGWFDDHYDKIEELGEGNYGTVFKVEYYKNFFALKKVKFNNNCQKEFINELKFSTILTKIKNDRLLKYIDIWLETENSNFIYYIQMELCDKSLKDVIKAINKGLTNLPIISTYSVAGELLTQILEGVNFLHTYDPKIIHRDLKPDNILIIYTDNRGLLVKIADFGLMVYHNEIEHLSTNEIDNKEKVFGATSHTTDIGDLKYMSPEVEERRIYDTKSDIYSLGVILQEIFLIFLSPSDELKRSANHTLLEDRLKNLIIISENMLKDEPNERPDCEEILKSKPIWGFDINELKHIFEEEKANFLLENKDLIIFSLLQACLVTNLENAPILEGYFKYAR